MSNASKDNQSEPANTEDAAPGLDGAWIDEAPPRRPLVRLVSAIASGFKALLFRFVDAYGSGSQAPEPTQEVPPQPTVNGDAWQQRWEKRLENSRFMSIPDMEVDLRKFLDKGLDDDSVALRYEKEKACLTSYLIAKHRSALDLCVDKLDPAAFSDWLEAKVPTLKAWAMNNISDSAILPTRLQDNLDWARSKGFMGHGIFRESHFAEALLQGNAVEAAVALDNAGIDRMTIQQVEKILRAFASRKTEGLDALPKEGLEFLLEAAEFEQTAIDLQALGGDELLNAAELLLLAISGDAEHTLADRVLEIKNEKSRKQMSEALLKGAMAHGSEAIVSAVLGKSSAYMGVPARQAMQARSSTFLVKAAAGASANVKVAGGVSLTEVAAITGAAKMVETAIGEKLATVPPARMAELQEATKKAVDKVRRDWGGQGAAPAAAAAAPHLDVSAVKAASPGTTVDASAPKLKS